MRWLLPLLPTFLAFGPLFILMAGTSEIPAVRMGGYAASVALSFGLIALFSLLMRQERRIAALEERAGPPPSARE